MRTALPLLLVPLLAQQAFSASTRVPGNLIGDPRADAGGAGWTTSREGATIELVDGDATFVVRNDGSFQHVVPIPVTAPGTHVVLLARASSERINANESITGLPYLYGLVMGIERGRIIGYLQGQGMLSRARRPNEWTTLWGMFPLPDGATAIAVSLKLAERRGDPHNGSAGRFDNVTLVLVPGEREAQQFLRTYGVAAPTSGAQEQKPTIETLRARAQERMRQDLSIYSREDMQALEALYQSANRDLRAPEARGILDRVVKEYPKSNRAGSAVLYLAQMSSGADREAYLKTAIKDHSDTWYGNGVQVGAFARAQLAMYFAASDKLPEAKKLAREVEERFPGAVDHAGRPLVDMLQKITSR